MGSYSFKLPDIGEGIAEAEVVAWHVQVGDVVEEDAPLADMMTDKATIELTTPVAGKVVRIAGAIGDMIATGSVLVEFEIEGDAGAVAEPVVEVAPNEAAQVVKPDPVPEPVAVVEEDRSSRAPSRDAGVSERVSTALDTNGVGAETTHRRVLASPAVRQRAKDLGVDLADLKIEGDRVRHADLDAFLSYNSGGGYRPAGGARADEQVKVVGLRRRIAENMAASKRAIPHFTYVEEIDVTKLEELRADLNATRGAKPKLTMLPLLITAICKTVPAIPDDQRAL